MPCFCLVQIRTSIMHQFQLLLFTCSSANPFESTNIQTDKQTRQTNKQPDNQTNRQISFESTNRSKENNLRYPIWDLTRNISQIFLFLKLLAHFSVGKELIGPTFVCRKACKLVNPATASSELSRTYSYSDLYFNSIQVQFNPSWHVKHHRNTYFKYIQIRSDFKTYIFTYPNIYVKYQIYKYEYFKFPCTYTSTIRLPNISIIKFPNIYLEYQISKYIFQISDFRTSDIF